MKRHPRSFSVQQAEIELKTVFMAIRQKHDLTTIEAIAILNAEIASILKFALRAERDDES